MIVAIVAVVVALAVAATAVLVLVRGVSKDPENQVWGSPPDEKAG